MQASKGERQRLEMGLSRWDVRELAPTPGVTALGYLCDHAYIVIDMSTGVSSPFSFGQMPHLC